jgi:hypothetical protein
MTDIWTRSRGGAVLTPTPVKARKSNPGKKKRDRLKARREEEADDEDPSEQELQQLEQLASMFATSSTVAAGSSSQASPLSISSSSSSSSRVAASTLGEGDVTMTAPGGGPLVGADSGAGDDTKKRSERRRQTLLLRQIMKAQESGFKEVAAQKKKKQADSRAASGPALLGDGDPGEDEDEADEVDPELESEDELDVEEKDERELRASSELSFTKREVARMGEKLLSKHGSFGAWCDFERRFFKSARDGHELESLCSAIDNLVFDEQLALGQSQALDILLRRVFGVYHGATKQQGGKMVAGSWGPARALATRDSEIFDTSFFIKQNRISKHLERGERAIKPAKVDKSSDSRPRPRRQGYTKQSEQLQNKAGAPAKAGGAKQ